MNFGDRLKQLRTQKNLTQPQLAQAIGIEQSYLSKLENDKSIPGADIFQSILRALAVDVATFLEGVDDNIVHRELRQVPEVANHINGQMAVRIHSVKRWLFVSGALGVLGLTLFFAGHQKLFGSGLTYTYESAGVAHPDEPTDIFEFGVIQRWLTAKVRAGEISEQEFSKRDLELMSRMQADIRILDESRGDGFIAQVPGGTRLYKLKSSAYNDPPAHRYAMLAGLLLTFASLFGFIVEARLRSFKKR